MRISINGPAFRIRQGWFSYIALLYLSLQTASILQALRTELHHYSKCLHLNLCSAFQPPFLVLHNKGYHTLCTKFHLSYTDCWDRSRQFLCGFQRQEVSFQVLSPDERFPKNEDIRFRQQFRGKNGKLLFPLIYHGARCNQRVLLPQRTPL